MPHSEKLKEELEKLGIYDEKLDEQQQQLRLARFEGTTFGVAPKEAWGKLRQQLLDIEP
jgi:hypothetical protein